MVFTVPYWAKSQPIEHAEHWHEVQRCRAKWRCQQTADPSSQSAANLPDFAKVDVDFKRNSAFGNFVGSAAIVAGQSTFSPPHQDAVTDLKITHSEEHSLLLSSGRDGVVHVWKADYLSGGMTGGRNR